MNPIALSAQALLATLELYRAIAGKPKDWVPTAQDWDELEAWAQRTPEQIKAAALNATPGAPR